MSEENQNPESPKPNTDLPKFDLPKAVAPAIRTQEAPQPASVPNFATQKPASFGAPVAAETAERPALLILDALAAAVAVAFAVLILLDK